MNRLFLSLSLILLLSACQVSAVPTATPGSLTPGSPTAVANADDLMSQDLFQGFYAYGFETSAFTPCGVKEQWWVTPADGEIGLELVNGYKAITAAQNRPVYARLRGKITAKGGYGHLDMFQRGFTVTEIIDLRASQDGDCN